VLTCAWRGRRCLRLSRPFLLRRAGFDPATSSAPFVATLVDVTGLVIYFQVAAAVLRGRLL
jgi:magnesium transporter